LSPLPLSLRFLQTQPDARLIALAQMGHDRAFEALFRRYRRQLLGYCRRISPPTASAEDAVQQTFLQALVALRAGHEVRDARSWLYRIAHNVVVSSVRQQLSATELDDQSAAQGADAEAEQRLAVREALAGLASLPGLQRDAMVGAAVDGLTHAEIARELGLTSGAVRGLIYRARSTLRVAAALFVPGGVVDWAVRQGAAETSFGRVSEAIAGGSSAGVGGLLLKGGAITATAGVLATAAGVVTHHKLHPRARPVARVLAATGDHARRAFAARTRSDTSIPWHSTVAPGATAVEVAALPTRRPAQWASVRTHLEPRVIWEPAAQPMPLHVRSEHRFRAPSGPRGAAGATVADRHPRGAGVSSAGGRARGNWYLDHARAARSAPSGPGSNNRADGGATVDDRESGPAHWHGWTKWHSWHRGAGWAGRAGGAGRTGSDRREHTHPIVEGEGRSLAGATDQRWSGEHAAGREAPGHDGSQQAGTFVGAHRDEGRGHARGGEGIGHSMARGFRGARARFR
jgi:RNA polymerase sigma-70 factor (ECF subfamily)